MFCELQLLFVFCGGFSSHFMGNNQTGLETVLHRAQHASSPWPHKFPVDRGASDDR